MKKYDNGHFIREKGGDCVTCGLRWEHTDKTCKPRKYIVVRNLDELNMFAEEGYVVKSWKIFPTMGFSRAKEYFLMES